MKVFNNNRYTFPKSVTQSGILKKLDYFTKMVHSSYQINEWDLKDKGYENPEAYWNERVKKKLTLKEQEILKHIELMILDLKIVLCEIIKENMGMDISSIAFSTKQSWEVYSAAQSEFHRKVDKFMNLTLMGLTKPTNLDADEVENYLFGGGIEPLQEDRVYPEPPFIHIYKGVDSYSHMIRESDWASVYLILNETSDASTYGFSESSIKNMKDGGYLMTDDSKIRLFETIIFQIGEDEMKVSWCLAPLKGKDKTPYYLKQAMNEYMQEHGIPPDVYDILPHIRESIFKLYEQSRGFINWPMNAPLEVKE